MSKPVQNSYNYVSMYQNLDDESEDCILTMKVSSLGEKIGCVLASTVSIMTGCFATFGGTLLIVPDENHPEGAAPPVGACFVALGISFIAAPFAVCLARSIYQRKGQIGADQAELSFES